MCPIKIPNERPPRLPSEMGEVFPSNPCYRPLEEMTQEQIREEYTDLKEEARWGRIATKTCSVIHCPLHWIVFYNPLSLGALYCAGADIFDCQKGRNEKIYCTQTVCISGCYEPAPPPSNEYRLNQLYSDPCVCCTFCPPCNGETLYNYLPVAKQERFSVLHNHLLSNRPDRQDMS